MIRTLISRYEPIAPIHEAVDTPRRRVAIARCKVRYHDGDRTFKWTECESVIPIRVPSR